MRKLAVSIVHHSMGSDRQQLGGGPVNKLLALAFLLSFCAASVGASLDALWQDNHSPLSAGTSVMGVLMNLSQQPEANTRVLLVPVRVLDFRGKDICRVTALSSWINCSTSLPPSRKPTVKVGLRSKRRRLDGMASA